MTNNIVAPSISSVTPTGKAAFYLHSCPVLTWLYLHGQLVVDPNQVYIRSGKTLDAQRFSNKRSIDLSPYGRCDWITGAQTNPVIHEGSRGKRHNEPKRAQLRHYLWAAKELYGIDAMGELHLKKGNIERVEPDHEAVERDHQRLMEIMEGAMPEPKKIPICKGCTNKDWCWQ